MSRYASTPRIAAGKQQGTPRSAVALARAIRNGQIKYRTRVLKELERLDVIAGEVYGDARLFWVIAAASGIGWGLQAPPGTVLKIPTDLAQVRSITG